MQAELLQQRFGIKHQRFQFVVALLGPGELEHLDFLKLMLAEDAASVLAGGASFGAKAGGPGAGFDGQKSGIEGFVAIEAGELNLGGGGEPKVGAFEMKHFRGKFGQLANAGKRRRVHQERRKIFGVAVASVDVEKEICQGALEPRSQRAVKGKSRTGNFGGARQVENAGALAQFPVGARSEIELRWRSPAPHFHVGCGVAARGNGGMGKVGNRKHELLESGVELGGALVGLLDFIGDALHFRKQGIGIFAGALASGNFFAGAIALGFEALDSGNDFAALAIEGAEGGEIDDGAAGGGHLLELGEMLAEIIQIMHEAAPFRYLVEESCGI